LVPPTKAAISFLLLSLTHFNPHRGDTMYLQRHVLIDTRVRDKHNDRLIEKHAAPSVGGIRDGRFVQKWRREQESGYPMSRELRSEAESHPLNDVERKVRELLKYAAE
jgi:ketol-acid reductoisomerase